VEFDWDEGNRDKNLRHGIHDWEIEEAFDDPQRKAGGAHRERGERRRSLLGHSRTSGQYLKIVYTVRVKAGREFARPISAMRMTPAERARYER
jgi:uncharacterized DUF497 family protein